LKITAHKIGRRCASENLRWVITQKKDKQSGLTENKKEEKNEKR
jgi:hypothetical protein